MSHWLETLRTSKILVSVFRQIQYCVGHKLTHILEQGRWDRTAGLVRGTVRICNLQWGRPKARKHMDSLPLNSRDLRRHRMHFESIARTRWYKVPEWTKGSFYECRPFYLMVSFSFAYSNTTKCKTFANDFIEWNEDIRIAARLFIPYDIW